MAICNEGFGANPKQLHNLLREKCFCFFYELSIIENAL